MTIAIPLSPTLEAIETPDAPGPVGPYAQAVRTAGGLVFVSGQLPIGADGVVAVDASPAEQLGLCLANGLAIAKAAGAGIDSIARVTIYTTRLDASVALNEVYSSVFDGWMPARSMVEVSSLPKGASVEVEITAAASPAAAAAIPTADAPLRHFTPAADGVVYLNTGTAGPPLAPALDDLLAAAALDASVPRTTMTRFLEISADADRARAALGALVGAGPESIAITHNTTEGMNIATWGLDWKPGDRVLTTNAEHAGGLLPLYQLANRFGVEIDFVDLTTASIEEVVPRIAAALTPATKLLSISHVSWSTGALYPLAEIVELAHKNDTLVLADGAQSFAAVELDLPATTVDFYAFPGQKWLCGPEGTGGLYVSPAGLEKLEATFVGFFGIDYAAYRVGDAAGYAPAPGAKRFEVGSAYHPAIAALASAAEWHLSHRASAAVTDHIHALAEYAIGVFETMDGIDVVTERGEHAGLVSVRITQDVDEATLYLAERGVDVRSVHDTNTLRLSCGFYNTRAEIDLAARLIGEFVALGAPSKGITA